MQIVVRRLVESETAKLSLESEETTKGIQTEIERTMIAILS